MPLVMEPPMRSRKHKSVSLPQEVIDRIQKHADRIARQTRGALPNFSGAALEVILIGLDVVEKKDKIPTDRPPED